MSNFLPLLIKRKIEEYQLSNRRKKSMGIVNYDEFTIENIKIITEYYIIQQKTRNIRLSYNDNTLLIQTPKLRNLYGICYDYNKYTPEESSFCYLSFDLTTPKGREFHDSMISLQNLIAKAAYKNRVEWGLGGMNAVNMTENNVYNKMIPIVQIQTGDKIDYSSPYFRVNFKTRLNEATGKIEAIISSVYDHTGTMMINNQLNRTTIPAESYCKILMHVNIWTDSYSYGCNLEIHQIRVYPE
jgi:hypothetical protein